MELRPCAQAGEPVRHVPATTEEGHMFNYQTVRALQEERLREASTRYGRQRPARQSPFVRFYRRMRVVVHRFGSGAHLMRRGVL